MQQVQPSNKSLFCNFPSNYFKKNKDVHSQRSGGPLPQWHSVSPLTYLTWVHLFYCLSQNCFHTIYFTLSTTNFWNWAFDHRYFNFGGLKNRLHHLFNIHYSQKTYSKGCLCGLILELFFSILRWNIVFCLFMWTQNQK